MGLVTVAICAVCTAGASWYWPFGGDAKPKPPRISELMEPATELIDNAADYAEDGDIDKAVEEYRKALAELDRIELENPDRADKPEFATLRNKRAYVNSAIDSLLLSQAQKNAASVAITDTTALEKEYAKRKADARAARSGRRPGRVNDDTRFVNEGMGSVKGEARRVKGEEVKGSRRARLQMAMEDLRDGDYDDALATVRELLREKPNDAAVLNLKARIESARGDLRAAEKTLDSCIQSNPKSYYAYYNMARLFLQVRGEAGATSAARYYRMGRDLGGPKDAALEDLVK